MTSRERMIRTFNFSKPDRLPVYYHTSPAGLYVHGEKLLKLFQKYPPDNPVEFKEIPRPDPAAIKNGIFHETKTDAWGTTYESIIFGIQGHPKDFPLRDYTRLKDYKFPPLPELKSDQADKDSGRNKKLKENYLVFGGGLSLFERLQALRPMDDVLVDLYTQDENFLLLLDRLTDYMLGLAKYLVGIGAEVIMCGDDWGIQTGPIISPEVFREIFRPRYEKLFSIVKKAGCRIFFHSCGSLGQIFDELADLGIDGIWHQVNRFAENEFAQKCRTHNITAFIHPDRQHLIPLGTPQEIHAQIKRYAEIYHKLGGGGIFYIEIENDAPFENVEALIEAVHEYA